MSWIENILNPSAAQARAYQKMVEAKQKEKSAIIVYSYGGRYLSSVLSNFFSKNFEPLSEDLIEYLEDSPKWRAAVRLHKDKTIREYEKKIRELKS